MPHITRLLFLLFSSLFYGQSSYELSGTVLDSGNKAVTIGDVLLFIKGNETPFKYTIVDAGKFSFESVVEGTYLLKISCLGFERYEQHITLNQKLTLNIQLIESATVLDEVKVVAIKPVFSNKNGNLKMNVENPVFSAIPDPIELLSKLPGIQISPDRETVTVIGKGAPLLYIGNRRIDLNELNAMSVDDISSIEIIQNPSSRYEAEGRSVLLITRKISNTEGIKLELSETASFKRNFNNYSGINGTYKKNKLTLKGNFAYNDLQTWESNGFEFRIPQQDILTDYLVEIEANDRFQSNGGGGLYYQITDTDYFSVNTTVSAQTDKFPIETVTFLKEGDEENNILTNTQNDNTKDYFSGNFNYNKKLGNKINLFFGLQYSSFLQKLNTDISNNYNETQFVLSQLRQQKYRIGVWAYRFDLEKTFKNSIKWEVGANISTANANALTQIQNLDPSGDTNIDYDYAEKIYASYTQLSGNIVKKMNYSLGLRVESNDVKGELRSGDSPLVNRKNTLLFPKANLNISIDSTKNLTFNYAKSINRPNFSNTSSITVFINPFLEGSNNINLKPTLTDEVSANFQWKNNSFSVNYYLRKNPTYYSISYDGQQDRAILSPTNLDEESGFDISVAIPITHKFWTATNYAIVSAKKIKDPLAEVTSAKPYLYVYTNHQFKIGKDTTLSLGGWGMTKRNEGIFKRNALIVMDAAITKTFFKKLRCSVRFNDITRAMNFEESYTINGVEADGVFFGDGQEIAMSIKYSLGKIKDPSYKNKDVDENLGRIR